MPCSPSVEARHVFRTVIPTHMSMHRTTLPQVCSLPCLEILNLMNNRLKTLPAGIGGLKKLRILGLKGNLLETLPGSFGELEALKVGRQSNMLMMSSKTMSWGELGGPCTCVSTPACICLSCSLWLQELFITDNKLRKFPEGFGNLRSLVKLQASFNCFEDLPEELGDLPCLELMRVRDVAEGYTDGS